MGRIVVNRLRLNQLYVGYRVQTLSNTGNTVYFDVSNDMLNPFLKLLGDVKVSKGTVIDGKEVNGMFVTDNENNVHEVETISSGKELLDKYYFCMDSEVSELIDPAKEELNHITTIEASIQGKRVNLSEIIYGDFGDIPVVHSALNNAAEGVRCDVQAFPYQSAEEGNMRFQCSFIYFDDFLAFLHNLLISLNRKIITVSAWAKSAVDDRDLPVLKKVKLSCNCSQVQFVVYILEKLGLKGLKNISVLDYQVYWNDGVTDFDFDDNCYIACYYAKFPGYNQDSENPKDAKYQAKFFRPVKSKKKEYHQ